MIDFLSRLFLESPWRLGVFSFLLFGAVLFARLRFESQRARDWALPGTLLLILLLFVLQTAIETDREEVLARLDGFVTAIEAPDIAALGEFIADDYAAEEFDRAAFLEALAHWLTVIDVEATRYRRRDVTVTGDTAVLQLGAMATVRRNHGAAETHFGAWTIEWTRTGGLWRIQAIQMEMIDGQPISRMRPHLP